MADDPLGGGTVNDIEGTTDAIRTLTAVIRAAFPHRKVPDSAYERVARLVLREAGENTWTRMKVLQGIDSLEALVGGGFADLTAEEALPVLRRIEGTSFFGFVRQTTVVNLYEDEEVWEALGYEGPSFDKGGYIDRGFDDLDWLPQPRIEEYDGEPLEDVVSDLPRGTGAANTRPAAVPVGQNRSRVSRTDTGRSRS